jgi:hypothetical protein
VELNRGVRNDFSRENISPLLEGIKREKKVKKTTIDSYHRIRT